MKKNINKKIIYIYLLASLGLLFMLYYIWFRFVRERLPREIPFNLSIFGFFMMLYICLLYGFLVYRYLKPKGSSEIFYYFFKVLYKPFYYFDKLLKKPLFINYSIFKVLYNTILFFNLYETNNHKYFFIIFNIIPKIILNVIFIWDVFYMQRLDLFFYIIILGIFPLIYVYCIHALTNQLGIISNFLDKYYFVKILSSKQDEEDFEKHNEGSKFFVSLDGLEYIPEEFSQILYSKYFIYIQSCNLIFDFDLYKYTCIETGEARELYAKTHNIELPPIWIFNVESDEISKALISEFKSLMPMAYYFKAFIHTYHRHTLPKFKTFNIYILCSYLFCWVYILIISLHTLNLLDLVTFLTTIKDPENPFTLIKIFHNYNET